MGPYVPPREKAEWEKTLRSGRLPTAEVLAIAQRLRDNYYGWELTDRLHGGRWVSVENRDAYIECVGHNYEQDCNWRSEGPPGSGGGWDNPHLHQWNIHRVEAGIAEGIEF
jgi:hypothetical protein